MAPAPPLRHDHGRAGTGARGAFHRRKDAWHLIIPVVAVVAAAVLWGRSLPFVILAAAALLLAAAVLSAVHHAEVVALRIGEPFGSLVLAVAVTVIEVGLIVTLMVTTEGSTSAALARDTVFAALMITMNGMIGAALVVATLRGGEATFKESGGTAGLAAITALAALSLVLPSFTRSTPGPTLDTEQLAFAAVAALVVYLLFIFVQTVRHRDYFLPDEDEDQAESGPEPKEAAAEVERHAARPDARRALTSAVLLVAALVGVVGLAKATTPLIESAVSGIGLPYAAVGVSIALLVLLPESIAAVRAARRGRFQTSMNLAYGSAMASIGLTIPAIAVVTWVLGYEVLLGLSPTSIVLLAATVAASILTVVSGRASLLAAGVHLSLFAGFLVLVANP